MCGQILYWKKCRIVDQAATAGAEVVMAEDARAGVAVARDVVEAAVVTDVAVARDADAPAEVADAPAEVTAGVRVGRAAGAVRAVARPIPTVTVLDATNRRFCCSVGSIL